MKPRRTRQPQTPVILRDYQQHGVDLAVELFERGEPEATLTLAAPTGTGKSYVELEVLVRCPRVWLVTPRIEIITDLLTKLGYAARQMSEATLIKTAWVERITTPVRFRNALLRGELVDCTGVLLDEGHHGTATTYDQIGVLTGAVPRMAITASPFRGSPRETARFREIWGEPVWLITYPDAVAQGVLAMPTLSIKPLLDDDVIEVQNGEFEARSVKRAYQSRLADAVALVSEYWAEGEFDRATVCNLPGTEILAWFAEKLDDAGIEVAAITQATSFAARGKAFEACEACRAVLLQIAVVGEGVDRKFRRGIDLSPVLSPVKWLQYFGRFTRVPGPGEAWPEYVCTNRNLLRHAYLLSGLVPAAAIKASEEAFGGPGMRVGARVMGLESMGRLKADHFPLANGTTGSMYAISALDGESDTLVRDYACLLTPNTPDALWATRTRTKADASRYATYGRWARCEAPSDLKGYASLPARDLTPGQRKFWLSAASRYGLDVRAKVTSRNFQALPVLRDIGVRAS